MVAIMSVNDLLELMAWYSPGQLMENIVIMLHACPFVFARKAVSTTAILSQSNKDGLFKCLPDFLTGQQWSGANDEEINQSSGAFFALLLVLAISPVPCKVYGDLLFRSQVNTHGSNTINGSSTLLDDTQRVSVVELGDDGRHREFVVSYTGFLAVFNSDSEGQLSFRSQMNTYRNTIDGSRTLLGGANLVRVMDQGNSQHQLLVISDWVVP